MLLYIVTGQPKRIADALEEILRLVKEDEVTDDHVTYQERSKKYMGRSS